MFIKVKNNINIPLSACLLLSAVATLILLLHLMCNSYYGLDLSDESFYLVWISNPFIYDASATQFGYLYHPLYALLNGSLSALRQANIIITFALAWCLSATVMRYSARLEGDVETSLLIVSAGLATSSLSIFDTSLLTPSYNSLALQALMITSIGILLAARDLTYRSFVGWALIAIGGWLAFMSKPTTAAALALVTSLYLIISRKASVALICFAVFIVSLLLFSSALLIDGSLGGFLNRILMGVDDAKILGGGYSMGSLFRLDDFNLGKAGKLVILTLCLMTSVAMWGSITKTYRGTRVSFCLLLLSFVSIIFFTISRTTILTRLGEFQGLAIFGVMIAATSATFLARDHRPLPSLAGPDWALAFLFLVMPHIFAFGTNRNYWVNGAWAGIFWLLSSIILAAPVARKSRSWSFAVPLAFSTQIVVAALIQSGVQNPQRQPEALYLNDVTLKLGQQKTAVTLASTYAAYLSSVISQAAASGFKPKTPVIDLTGQSPGVLYAIGAKSIGQAWMIGAYPGSQQLAEVALRRASCDDIGTAWVLLEPEGPRSISPQLLRVMGLLFPENYRKMATWTTPSGAGGYDEIRIQDFYAPRNPQASVDACLDERVREPS
ncbi:hypothetical protein [Agrobacterium cavarae]|uniref:hypothetical protein n=1 Tax=Agrobacterium cavarae TaxID=2528239 RepID=UPI000DDF98F0|nr:hypothetical protein [Agrobacterium cavarae]